MLSCALRGAYRLDTRKRVAPFEIVKRASVVKDLGKKKATRVGGFDGKDESYRPLVGVEVMSFGRSHRDVQHYKDFDFAIKIYFATTR